MKTFDITVSNDGRDDVTNVVVTDTLPGGTTFVSATPSQGSCSGTTSVVCSLGTLANGASATISITVRIESAGTISNSATVISDVADPTPGNAASTATFVALAATAIPTASEWALIALGLALAAIALRRL